MQRKRKEILKEEEPVWRRRAAIAAVVLAVVVILGFVIARSFLQSPEVEFSLKAAIVDQLGGEVPNSDFNETGAVADMLRTAGFNVTYYSNETVDVAFYRGLAKYNYGLIILRSHAALREDGSTVDIFTNEEYNANKYVLDQNNDLLTKGSYSWKPEKYYFAISPRFIENLEGTFPKSVIIAMGCHTMNDTTKEMAEAFVKKGAKMYVGWTGLVGYSQTDNNTEELVKRLLVENKTLAAATLGLNDPTEGSMMKYYPPEAGSMRISDLISEARSSLSAHAIAKNSEPQLMRTAQYFQIPVRPNCVVKRFSRLETVAYS